MKEQIKRAVASLAAASETGGIEPLSQQIHNLSIIDAYQIQLATVHQAVLAGDMITGKKIGLTSQSMQLSVGVMEPDYGHLLASMAVKQADLIDTSRLHQPRVEGELAFHLSKQLRGPGVTVMDVIIATDYIVPALEIVDSRIKDWRIKLVDTIADNASAGFYVLGEKRFSLFDLSLDQVGMNLYKNNELMNTGVGAACLEHPINGVVWLANKLASFDLALEPGEIILSGALSSAVSAKAGDSFTAEFYGLGDVSISFQ